MLSRAGGAGSWALTDVLTDSNPGGETLAARWSGFAWPPPKGVVRRMCCPGSLQVALRSLATTQPSFAAQVALVALTGAAEGPGEVITLRALRRALPSLRPGILRRAGEQLAELGHWARHPDGFVSLPGDVDPLPDTQRERRRAQWRAYKQRVRAPKVASPIATPPPAQGAVEPKQGHVDTCETGACPPRPQQVFPGFLSDVAEGVHNVHGGRPHAKRARTTKAPKVKRPREKTPKDLRLELVRARYVAAYLERFGVEPGLPAWSLVQRVETWLRRNAPKIGKTFDELTDLVITGYFMDDWALDTECPFKPLSDNPARFYRAAAGLTEPRRIPRRFVAPAPPSPPGSCDADDLEQIRRQNAETRARIEADRAQFRENARLLRAQANASA